MEINVIASFIILMLSIELLINLIMFYKKNQA